MAYNFTSTPATTYHAYILGLMCSNEKTVYSGTTYWLMPIRHNPNPAIFPHLYIQLSYLKKIYSGFEMLKHWKSLGYSFNKYNAGKNGIVGLALHQSISNIVDLSHYICSDFIRNPSRDFKRSFLIGLFDGRSAFDSNNGWLALDISDLPDFMVKRIEDILIYFGISYNINSSYSARKRKSGAAPRQPQLRIADLEKFLKDIGLISEVRFNNSYKGLLKLGKVSPTLTSASDPLLPGLKILK